MLDLDCDILITLEIFVMISPFFARRLGILGINKRIKVANTYGISTYMVEAKYVDSTEQLVTEIVVRDIPRSTKFYIQLGLKLYRDTGDFVELTWEDHKLFIAEISAYREMANAKCNNIVKSLSDPSLNFLMLISELWYQMWMNIGRLP